MTGPKLFGTLKIEVLLLCLIIATAPVSMRANNISIGLLALYSVISYLKSPFGLTKHGAFLLLPSAIVFAYALGLPWTDSLSEGLFQVGKRNLLLVLPVCIWAIHKRLAKSDVRQVLYFFVCVTIILSIVCYANALKTIINEGTIKLSDASERQYFYFTYTKLTDIVQIDPIYLSIFSNLSLIIILFNPLPSRRLTLSAAVYLVLFTFLISSKIGIICVVMILFLHLVVAVKNKLAAIGIGTCVILAFSVAIYNTEFLKSRFEFSTDFDYSMPHLSGWNSTSQRIAIWTCVFEAIDQVFPFGYGTGDGQAELQKKYLQKHYVRGYEDLSNAHNEYLYITLDLGVFGLLLMMILTFGPLAIAIRKEQYMLAFFMLLYTTYFLVEVLLARRLAIFVFSMFYPLLAIGIFERKGNS